MSWPCVLVCWRSGGSTLYRNFDVADIDPLEFARQACHGAVYVVVSWDGIEWEWEREPQ